MNIDSNHPEHLINNINIATQNLAAGYSCSEAVLLTYAPLFNLPSNSAFKIASGFGGGMAMGETCGAVTAAFMVIGLRYGADNVNDSGSRELTYRCVTEFAERFKSLAGSINCRDLIGEMDISSPDDRKLIREKGMVPETVTKAIVVLEEIFRKYDNFSAKS